ncbi:uncharacterized protein BYT42DRAFT_489793 [Radiomyces spectabilis]|uniref:uncharacterized protein n=1 Tax=Radiomyces spectabilis TaxID=64574 RepID=UPI002220A227|nr:uncharacterized protein BYT42DRAFT_489793 [Radiomyces spectabilis]KAI8391150.1 hypothetical protein BYT42DRAFT_489793 [Radiomyces spectabilis]
MPSETQLADSFFEDDAYAASQSLEEELLGKGYMTQTPLGASLAAELHSATSPISPTTQETPLSPTAVQRSLSTSLIQEYASKTFPANINPVSTPLHFQAMHSSSTGFFCRSRRSSFSSTWSSLDAEDDDPFEQLKRQLEELNSNIWETKTLHKRLCNTLLADESLFPKNQTQGNFAPPPELPITSFINVVERKWRDRERQTSHLKNIGNSIRKEMAWMSKDDIKDLEMLVNSMMSTLHDRTFSYENPLPVIRSLNMDTLAVTDSLEELKELMFVNKHQVQELNSRLRSIAKTVHEVRKDIRRINKFLEEKDDDDAVVLERGEVQARVKEIMWGLDDLDNESSQKVKQIQTFLEEEEKMATAP